MPGPLRPCWSRRPARVTGRCCRRSWLPAGEPQSKSLALRQWLESDISYRFRLFANPTVTRQGKRYGLVGEEQQLAWLARQGERHGFVVEAALVTFSEVLGSRKRQTRISVLRAAFEGVCGSVARMPLVRLWSLG